VVVNVLLSVVVSVTVSLWSGQETSCVLFSGLV